MNMNIIYGFAANSRDRSRIICPGCHCSDCRKHGVFIRKGFHRNKCNQLIIIVIPRFRCLNPECKRCTFSVLPPYVLPYCRFFWPHLLRIKHTLATGLSFNNLAQFWHVGRRVIARAATLLNRMEQWISQVHQEVSNGAKPAGFVSKVKIVMKKLGCIELISRWYTHHYNRLFMNKNDRHTNRL